jgi:adenine-specific DNA-methyltransferase
VRAQPVDPKHFFEKQPGGHPMNCAAYGQVDRQSQRQLCNGCRRENTQKNMQITAKNTEFTAPITPDYGTSRLPAWRLHSPLHAITWHTNRGHRFAMVLTDDEKREVQALVAKGEALPEKYRWKLFAQPRQTELIWPGKTSEVTNVVLPFQVIEHVDEPREEKVATTTDLFATGATGRQSGGWTNKLIWGDNKLVLSSLKNGPLRREIEAAGGLKLVYIDPPFDLGADFSIEFDIGDETLTKEPSVVEDIAYRDTWGRGHDSYVSMIHERLLLIRDLLSDDATIFVHVGWQVAGLVRPILDEIFGNDRILNELIWKRTPHAGSSKARSTKFPVNHETIFWYSKSKSYSYHHQYEPYSEDYKKRFSNPDKDERGPWQSVSLKTFSTETFDRLKF